MANRTDTQSVINLVINGKQAMTSLKELTDTQRRLNTEMRNMRPSDPGYPARLRELQAINQALSDQRREMQGLNSDAENLKLNWKDITAGILSANVFQKVEGWVSNAVIQIKDAFKETEKFRAILTTAFNGNADFADKSLKMLSNFAAKTPFQLEEATAGFIKLVNRGFVPTQQEMVKMGDLAASQGKSFDQYIEALLDAQTGEFERLKEFGIKASKNGDMVSLSFKGMTKEVANTDQAIRNAMLAFGDMQGVKGSMEGVSQTVEGLASNIDDTWSQIFAGIGKGSSGMINGFYRAYGGLLSWFKEKFVDVSVSEQMEKDRFELVKLEMQLKSANTTQEDRVAILKKLKEQYPEYFKNINAEKINTDKLTLAFKQLNQEYLNKIVLQKQNESLEKSENERADTKLRQFKAEADIRDYLARIKDKAPGLKLFGKTDVDQAKSLLSQLEANGNKAMAGVSRFAKNDLKNLLSDYKFLDDKFLNQTTATNKILNERQRLAKSLGINPDQDLTIKTVENPIKEQKTAPKVDNKKAESEAKKNLAILKKMDEDYKKLGIEHLEDQLSKNQKEVDQESRKYDELIARHKNYLELKRISAEERKKVEDRIAQLTSDKDKALSDLRARQEAETTGKILELRTRLTNAHENELQKEKDLINKFYDGLEKENSGNQNVINSLKIQRTKDLSEAELREKKRLEEEKRKVESEYGIQEGTAREQKLAKIKKQYDDEIIALKEKFSKEVQETQLFHDTIAAIEKRRNEANAAVNTNNDDDEDKKKKEALIQVAQSISDAYFSIAANNRQRETDMALRELDRQREGELSNKNLTEKQKAAINAKYDAKIKAEKLKAWQADRNAALSQAIINGALAVVKALPNVFASVAAGVAAAAQIAVIAAQKPPEFGVGVRNFKGGKAVVGEKGPELVNENGNLWLAQEATLADLAPGTDVYTAGETAAMLSKKSLAEKMYPQVNYSIDTASATKAERNYRSNGLQNSTSTTSVPGSYPANSTSIDNTAKILEKMDQFIEAQKAALDRPINFVYSNFEEFQDKIKYDRNRQSG